MLNLFTMFVFFGLGFEGLGSGSARGRSGRYGANNKKQNKPFEATRCTSERYS